MCAHPPFPPVNTNGDWRSFQDPDGPILEVDRHDTAAGKSPDTAKNPDDSPVASVGARYTLRIGFLALDAVGQGEPTRCWRSPQFHQSNK